MGYQEDPVLVLVFQSKEFQLSV